MKKYLPIFFLTVILSVAFTFAPSQNNKLQKILANLAEYYENHPQQKVYLHLDKDIYKVGETVWLKAYLLDGVSHQPSSVSTNLYLDLINPNGYLVQQKILRLRNGFSNGDFSFQDTVPEGRYKIVAFTNWMKNAGEDYFFTKDIYVKNPHFKMYATRSDVKLNKKSKRKIVKNEENISVDFLPEGGSLLAGIESRIAFKAINELGQGVDIEGELKDEKNKLILKFKTEFRGMGSFIFTPSAGVKYHVDVTASNNIHQKIHLPVPVLNRLGIKAGYTDNNLNISILNNISPDHFPSNTDLFLIAHIRGKIGFARSLDMKSGPFEFKIPVDSFPSGIVHISLFDYQMNPVSERLMFVYDNEPPRVDLQLSRASPSPREKTDILVRLSNKDNRPISGNFSLSITRSDELSNNRHIRSYLLLDSDLRGGIEEPDWYFINFNSEKLEKLDLVMLTNGWSRFDWNKVMSNPLYQPNWPIEKGLEVSGKITRQFFGIPLADIPVKMTILSSFNDSYSTRSDLKGRFSFKNLDYSDTVEVRIEAQKENKSKNLLIWIDEQESKRSERNNYYSQLILTKPGVRGRNTPPEKPEEEDPFYEENNKIYRIHSEPRDVIIVDETMRHYQNVAQIIQGRVPGVSVSGNKIVIRGASTFYGSTDPLFLLDGVPVDPSYAMAVSPNDIERIEILKGPEAAIYGINGANGVIAIYTRRGKFMIKGVLDFKMLGYATPKEFYSPRYDLRADEGIPDERTTLLWEPFLKSHNGEASVRFFTSDIRGRYSITLEGITEKGEAIAQSLEFEVH